jgi:hypothetical protein
MVIMAIIKILLIAILVVSLLGLGISFNKTRTIEKVTYPKDFKILGAASESGEVTNLIDVTGTYTNYVDPDKVDIYVGAQTDADKASDSQQQNAAIMQNIRNGLSLKGITSKSIQTTQYSLQQIREWDDIKREYVNKGYRTIHILKIKLTDINKAGEIIDIAVSNGANRVDNVVFGLSDTVEKQMRIQALTEAGKNAKEKADAIASGLGISITKVNRASESSVWVTPYYAMKENLAAGVAAAPTEISPGQIQISASVGVSYEFV